MSRKLIFSVLAVLLILTTGSAFAESVESTPAETAAPTASEIIVETTETQDSEVLSASSAFDLFLAVQDDLNYSPANPLAAVPSCSLECRRNSDCHPSGACRCIFIFPSCGFCNC